MNKSISINFDNSKYASQSSEYWLKLELVEEKDTATLGEIAELLDAIYEINPCNSKIENTSISEEKPEPIPIEDFQNVVRRGFDFNMCNTNFNNEYVVKVKVFKSHRQFPYVLKFDNGEIVSSTFTREQITENLTIENATSVTLSYTLAGNISTSLNNYVFTSNKTTTPTLKVDGSTISWDVPITASITVSYLTEYDLVEVKVFATDEGEMGECLMLGFYHGLVEELNLTPPDVDEDANDLYRSKYCGTKKWEITSEDNVTCYETRTLIYKCQCSGEVAYEVTEEVSVSCPQDIRCPRGFGTTIENGVATCSVNLGFKTVEKGYVDCGETTDDISDPAFYMEYCCDYPKVSLPKCDVYYAKNPGGKTLSVEKRGEYISEYGNLVEFISVSPEDGDCGNIKYNQVRNRKNCCDEATLLEWNDEESADIIARGTWIWVEVIGGIGPYHWSVRGTGFTLDGNNMRDGYTDARYARVYASILACGVCKVTVTDGCTSVAAKIRCTSGTWLVLGYDSVTCKILDNPDLYHPGLFLCSSYGYQQTPGMQNYYDGEFWAARTHYEPPNRVNITYARESYVCGLWALPIDGPAPLYINIPIVLQEHWHPGQYEDGTIFYPALYTAANNDCYPQSGGPVTAVLYWSEWQIALWKWIC